MSMVEWKKLGEVCDVYDGTHQTPQYTDCGVKFVSVENIHEPYNSNKYISEDDYLKNYRTKPQQGDVLMTRIGDVGTCTVLNREEPIAYYVSLALLRPNNKIVHSNYVKYILESNVGKRELRKKTLLTAVPLKINLGDVGKIQIPLPSLSEQQRIVSILDIFTSSIANLKQQIEERRKQYEYERDRLLDLEGKEGVEMKMPQFCFLKAGKNISAGEISGEPNDDSYPCYGGNGIRGYVPFYSHEGEYPIIGRQGALCGCVNWVSGKFYATEHAVVAKGKENTNQRFLFYLFVKADLNQYKSQGAQPGLSVAKLNDLYFKIPSLKEQSRIVSILDTFEASIKNLEAQLALREKQYEYYRNQLLTFE